MFKKVHFGEKIGNFPMEVCRRASVRNSLTDSDVRPPFHISNNISFNISNIISFNTFSCTLYINCYRMLNESIFNIKGCLLTDLWFMCSTYWWDLWRDSKYFHEEWLCSRIHTIISFWYIQYIECKNNTIQNWRFLLLPKW